MNAGMGPTMNLASMMWKNMKTRTSLLTLTTTITITIMIMIIIVITTIIITITTTIIISTVTPLSPAITWMIWWRVKRLTLPLAKSMTTPM